MKKEIKEKLEFPEGIDFEIIGNIIHVKGSGKESKMKFNIENVSIKELKMINTFIAHVKNMIKGIKEEFIYKLEICYVHFPMTLEVDKAKGLVIIKNFLGEKKPRTSKILKGAEIVIEKNKIIVSSNSKEIAGQTAANLEKATWVRNRDRRKFQDGIFMTEKCGRHI